MTCILYFVWQDKGQNFPCSRVTDFGLLSLSCGVPRKVTRSFQDCFGLHSTPWTLTAGDGIHSPRVILFSMQAATIYLVLLLRTLKVVYMEQSVSNGISHMYPVTNQQGYSMSQFENNTGSMSRPTVLRSSVAEPNHFSSAVDPPSVITSSAAVLLYLYRVDYYGQIE